MERQDVTKMAMTLLITLLFLKVWTNGEKIEQAGAELCQAQIKLGRAKIEINFQLVDN